MMSSENFGQHSNSNAFIFPQYLMNAINNNTLLVNLLPRRYGFPSSPTELELYDPVSTDPLHDELLQMCRATGIEDIAKEAGVIKNGEIPVLKDYMHRDSTPVTKKSKQSNDKLPTNPNILSSNHKSNHETKLSNTTTNTDTSNAPGSLSRQSSFQSSLHSSGSSIFSPSGDDSGDETGGKKRKRGSSFKGEKEDKSGHNKGLRHFSLKVCQKVETKRTTSYNEVADELVGEISSTSEHVVTPVEQKNIRRRVYDVLNVLMAMNIISKDKKEIHWIGLPTESKKPYDEYKKEKVQRLERIKRKKENLAELMAQQVSYRNLLARNTKPEYASTQMKNRIYLPFIVVNTKSTTVINCEVAHDRTKYFFNFSNPFEIYDDNEVLKRMGLGSCTYNDEPTSTNDSQFPRTNLTNSISNSST